MKKTTYNLKFKLYTTPFLFFTLLVFTNFSLKSQTPKSYTSSEIVQQINKLNVLGSVLYIAAHPDDENTRLLAYFANEKLYRTGYLSLTRGDGGQNLIGDEQGIDLGLIRTQELLAARRNDGAEQFFSTAFDFGYSKNPEEALKIWGHDKILSDVVWVIRKFKPDVIITRFPTTGEGGHGHHTASAILAQEAFEEAADSTKFPEQLKWVTPWQTKRLLWNTFNFGNINTQNENQFKIETGDYNALLGKSYGEIAALSRSQHKSQGFGVAAQRGSVVEYFKTIKGPEPKNDLMEGIDITWNRIDYNNISNEINQIIAKYQIQKPENSIADLVSLYNKIEKIKPSYWQSQKLQELKKIIENSSGIFIEAISNTANAVQGDSIKLTLTINNRLGAKIKNADAQIDDTYIIFDQLKKNINSVKTFNRFIPTTTNVTQPYWIEQQKEKGSFNVSNQQLIGDAESKPLSINFSMMIEDKEFVFNKPILYKFTDPVKGEIYQPVNIITPIFINTSPSLILFNTNTKNQINPIQFTIQANKNIADSIKFEYNYLDSSTTLFNKFLSISKNEKKILTTLIYNDKFSKTSNSTLNGIIFIKNLNEKQYFTQQKIKYDHIPEINYNVVDPIKIIHIDLKTNGSKAGYIVGAGDKIPDALEQMGYSVTILKEKDITENNLKQFDVIITGIRAYNTNEWLNNVYDVLMQFVKNGGVLLSQYNTSNSLGPIKAKVFPYPFTISKNRITDEEATVTFLQPNCDALNYPNKITSKDFEGWIQERSIYNSEDVDSHYQKILSMKDPNENNQDGSLIIAPYGKGKLVYTGLVFFRELPAGVSGAYRLFANLIAKPKRN